MGLVAFEDIKCLLCHIYQVRVTKHCVIPNHGFIVFVVFLIIAILMQNKSIYYSVQLDFIAAWPLSFV